MQTNATGTARGGWGAPCRPRAVRRQGLVALAAVALIAVLAGPQPASAAAGPQPRFGRGTLVFVQDGRRVRLAVEIADTPEARAHGLMYRRHLDEHAGMLFVFDEDARWGFWMKNTFIPLSIGFLDRTWRLLEIVDMAVAADPTQGPWPVYEPSRAYRYALEVNQGYFARRGLTPGARAELVVYK
ncbi:MAG: DUF192 domain-containing protein [Armatimonadota bacterium]|nr:DUF192 domain-containing protein [Armatimonadota bacterium]